MGVLEALGRLVPVVLAFGAGAVFARRKIIQAQESRAFTDFTFLFAIPCYLFGKIYSSDLRALFDWHAIGAYAVSMTVACVLVGVATRLLTSGGARAIALRIMAAVQVNTAYYAVPVFVMLFGDAAPIFPILLLQVCLLSTVVIAIMEFGSPGGDSGTARRLLRAVWASLNTPLVLACNLAIVANLVSVKVPSVVLDGLSFVGDAAAPVALFALGLYLGGTGVSIRGTTRTELALIAFKCLAFPLMTYALCRFVFGVGQPWLAYLTLIAAMPAPQNLFIFAQRYDIDVELSASVVVKSSAVTILLLPLWFQFA
ncbi:transporter [Actinosynnema sp. ALI-1.44]|uniref:AEC family transporter n=1 Tax=Actinosynnema sp. ALI-1.44 TaxID=1933779 RepID=UPI00097BCB2E|nr:AEC family transporter [Actinosynnema sp. ALI-1.44]ONI82963.1 transporter [Actinosynnema sp. ALI-1.44]